MSFWEFFLAVLFFGALPVLIVFYFYLRRLKIHNVSSSLSLQLFLVSIPESRPDEKENPNEARKNFIAQMEKFLIGLSGMKDESFFRLFGGAPSFALELAAHNDGSEIFFYIAFSRKFENLLQSQLHGAFPEA